MALEEQMTKWVVTHRHVSADELGAAASGPWIPDDARFESVGFTQLPGINGPDLIQFKDSQGNVVYALPTDSVRYIKRLDSFPEESK
jgi:hypothetical protein